MVVPTVPKPAPGNTTSIAARYARAKALKDAEEAAKVKGNPKEKGLDMHLKPKNAAEKLNQEKAHNFKREWGWAVGFFTWLA